MQRCFVLILIIFCAALAQAPAQSLDDQYVQIFNLIQEADSSSQARPNEALAKYLQAQSALQRIQRISPDWNSKIVVFRLSYVGSKISALSAKTGPPVTSATTTQLSVQTPAGPAQGEAAAPADWGVQLGVLKEQVRQLQADKTILEAKLKEAFSVQPAGSDPKELAKAQDRVKDLQKENDLLKITVEKLKAAPSTAVDNKLLEQAQQALKEANRQLADQKEYAAKLSLEKEALVAKVKGGGSDQEALAALRAENQVLKKQAALGQAESSLVNKRNGIQPDLGQAQAQIAALRSDNEVLRVEKQALQNRVVQLTDNQGSNTTQAPFATADEKGRVRQLERERDDLQRKLEAANKDLSRRKDKNVSTQVGSLQEELANVRARLDTYEARSVPYTTEELALFKPPTQPLPAATPSTDTDRKPARALSASAANLISEARKFYQAGQFDKAEATYLQVLKEDQNNTMVLADLASIQVEANHLEAAETNIKQALALKPDSAYSLSILGRLRFRQGKYDEAVVNLSRAAKLEPENAEIQNFLGLALSEKGMRGPAEAALRKAVQLEPNYATAHNNLAVVYITQKPPAAELAKWHYQKALAAGSPRNLALEKLIAEAK